MNTIPAARPRDQPRFALSEVTAGSIAMLRNRAITSVLISPRALSSDSTSTVVPSPTQTMRQMVWRIRGATQGGAPSPARGGGGPAGSVSAWGPGAGGCAASMVLSLTGAG